VVAEVVVTVVVVAVVAVAVVPVVLVVVATVAVVEVVANVVALVVVLLVVLLHEAKIIDATIKHAAVTQINPFFIRSSFIYCSYDKLCIFTFKYAIVFVIESANLVRSITSKINPCQTPWHDLWIYPGTG
jgi:hypothetical protein